MNHLKAKKRGLIALSSILALLLVVQGIAFAQPSSAPPGGNINATFQKVGIGNSSPTETLVVGEDIGNVSLNETLVIGDTFATGAPGLTIGESIDDNARINWSNALDLLVLYTRTGGVNNVSQLVLAGDGNVGVGTSSPSEKLVVGEDIGDVSSSEQIVVGGSSGAPGVTMGRSDAYNGRINYIDATDSLVLYTKNNGTANLSQLRLEGATGNVGVNGLPSATFQVGNSTLLGSAFKADHPSGVAIVDDSTTNSEPALLLGYNGLINSKLIFNSDTSNLEFMTMTGALGSESHDQQLVLAGNGNVGINAGSSITNQSLLVKPGDDSVNETVRGEYDSNNYGVLGGVNAGVEGVGKVYGVYAHSAQATANANTTTYGVYSEASSNGTGNNYSGWFSEGAPLTLGGTYHGLYADLREGDSIDIAEYILDTNDNLEAADVVIADPNNAESVIKSSTPYDTNTLGIISTKPHLTMGADIIRNPETGEEYEDVNAAKLTLAGRVPVKVTNENGQIKPGDLLTTSSTPGYAMKWTPLDETQAKDFEELKAIMAENTRRQNAIIGKALAPLDGEEGKIVALLSL